MISNYSWFNRSRIANVSLNSIPIKWKKFLRKNLFSSQMTPLAKHAQKLDPDSSAAAAFGWSIEEEDILGLASWSADLTSRRWKYPKSPHIRIQFVTNSFDDKIRIKMLFQNPLQMCVFATRIFRVRISRSNVVCISSWDCQSFLPKAAPKLTTMSRDLKLNKKGCQTLQNFLLNHADAM